MNIFAQIKEVSQYAKVTYYTILFEENDSFDGYSEFEKFIIAHSGNEEIKEEFDNILTWIEAIGDRFGAQVKYFRHERKADALPPKKGRLNKEERKLWIQQEGNLRLYCMRVNESIVFLFNGGIKTSGPLTAEDCNVVRDYFRMANKLADKITEAITDKEIILADKRIRFNLDFELIL